MQGPMIGRKARTGAVGAEQTMIPRHARLYARLWQTILNFNIQVTVHK